MPDKKLHLLIVKDKGMARSELLDFFRREGCLVNVLSTLKGAQEVMENLAFDALIAGEELLDGDGGDLYDLVRKHANAQVRAMPVIFYTGDAWYGEHMKAIEAYGLDASMAHVRPADGLPALLANVRELTGVAA